MRIAIYEDGFCIPITESSGDVAALEDSSLDDAFDFLPELEAVGLLRKGACIRVYDIYADRVGKCFASVAQRFGLLTGTHDDTGGHAIPYCVVRESDRAALERFVASRN